MRAEVDLTSQKAAIEAEAEEVEPFLQAVTPDFVKSGVGILSDQVGFWRWRNAVRLLRKGYDLVGGRTDVLQQVPLKTFIPLLEHGSLEEENDMQEKWAALLANAAVGSVDVTPTYPEILKQLSPMEVHFLDLIYQNYLIEKDEQKRALLQFSRERIMQYFKIEKEQADTMLENVFRLGLCRPPGSRGASLGKYPFAIQTTEFFELTTFGVSFISACKFKKKQVK